MQLTYIINRPRRKSAVNFMRQAVSLTGLGSTTFNEGIQSIIAIEDIFSRQVGDQNMEPWKVGTWQDWQTIYLSNRYFSSCKNHRNLQSVPFHHFVDPDGTLATISNSRNDLVHCADNVVEYYEMSDDGR
jgi:hypothetical protein